MMDVWINSIGFTNRWECQAGPVLIQSVLLAVKFPELSVDSVGVTFAPEVVISGGKIKRAS